MNLPDIGQLTFVLLYAVAGAAALLVSVRLIRRYRDRPIIAMTDAAIPEEVKTRFKIPVEITRVKEEKEEEKDGITTSRFKRVVIRRLKIPRNTKLFIVRTKIPGMRFAAHFVDYSSLTSDHKFRYDDMYSEPIDPQTGKPKRSLELSFIMANSMMGQGINVATLFTKFVFTKAHFIMMGICIGIGLITVFALNPIFHFTPTIEIRWVR